MSNEKCQDNVVEPAKFIAIKKYKQYCYRPQVRGRYSHLTTYLTNKLTYRNLFTND